MSELAVKNNAIGSTFIVAGTALGAGMLAMPLATAGVGFWTTFIMLVGLWAVMSYTALLLVEVYQHNDAETGLGSLAYKYLGRTGQWLTGLAMPFLLYSLVAAYLVGGGDIIQAFIHSVFGLSVPSYLGVIAFALVGALVVSIGTYSVDLVNRVLFTAKLFFLAAILMLLLPHVEQVNILTMPTAQALVLSAIPIVFTSFGFHGSVPSIVSYMEGNTRKLRWVFIIGSAIPLMVYVLWQLATLGSIATDTFLGVLVEASGINGLLVAVKTVAQSAYIDLVVRMFAGLALATSFLGVSLGLFDFLADVFKRKNNVTGRIQTSLITFLPPLFFALFYPKGFIFALGFAAIALAVLSLLLPSMLALKTRQQHKEGYQVKGGNLGLYTVFGLGLMIIGIQLAIVTGVLPEVG